MFGFTGEETDGTGLINLRARYYNPIIGQFFSLDPMEMPNRYQYAGANPLNLIDPAGHQPYRQDGIPPVEVVVLEPGGQPVELPNTPTNAWADYTTLRGSGIEVETAAGRMAPTPGQRPDVPYIVAADLLPGKPPVFIAPYAYNNIFTDVLYPLGADPFAVFGAGGQVLAYGKADSQRYLSAQTRTVPATAVPVVQTGDHPKDLRDNAVPGQCNKEEDEKEYDCSSYRLLFPYIFNFSDGTRIENYDTSLKTGIVYRSLRSFENPARGLIARNPGNRTISPGQHLDATLPESPWISTSKLPNIEEIYKLPWDFGGVAAIDLS